MINYKMRNYSINPGDNGWRLSLGLAGETQEIWVGYVPCSMPQKDVFARVPFHGINQSSLVLVSSWLAMHIHLQHKTRLAD